jgi:hypothetical protein
MMKTKVVFDAETGKSYGALSFFGFTPFALWLGGVGS